jgi:pimeloyl-ACP methyl ester carboxylesterase
MPRSTRKIETNGITLRVVVEAQGPLLILLHGFPQCWYVWRHQIDELVTAGYKVAIPDQRGYGGSDKPAGKEAYTANALIADTLGIADALGHQTFTLVTHDFGAVLGWDIALLHPERVTGVFALSVPPTRQHPPAFQQLLDAGHFLHIFSFPAA